MIGKVKSFNEVRKFGFIESGDETFYVRRAEIAPDEYGMTYLIVGELVCFTASHQPARDKHREALNVIPARTDETQDAPEDYREELIVKFWNPDRMAGMCMRPNNQGAWFYLNYREVVSLGFVKEGVHVWTGIRRSKRDARKFECFSTEVIKQI
jgi:cold shock CspA family protein